MKKWLLLLMTAALLFSCANRESDPTAPEEDPLDPVVPVGTGAEIEGIVEGRLSLNNSPYRVIGDLVVEAQKSLTIEPGVILLFREQRRLIVNGELIAEGQGDRPITFRADSTSWEGIKILDASAPATIKFCVVQDVDLRTVNGNENGAVEIRNATVTFNNNVFMNNAADFGGAIAVTEDSKVDIVNNVFDNNRCVTLGGAIFSIGAETTVINNTFVNNFALNVGGGIVFLLPAESEVQNNIFYQNSGFSGDSRVQFSGPDSGMVTMDFNFLALPEADPLFLSDTDFHLQTISPARNAGNPNTIFNDVDGSRNDLGAYGGPGGDW